MSDGTREARVAARWWAERIAGDDPINLGDTLGEVFAEAARGAVPEPSPEQVETFRADLERRILADVVGSGSWRDAVEKDDPQWGSALRTICVDYGPEQILADAAEVAGISRLRFPYKTVMWVSPGSVEVALGYGSPAVELELT